jgi:hypothetical protein
MDCWKNANSLSPANFQIIVVVVALVTVAVDVVVVLVLVVVVVVVQLFGVVADIEAGMMP